MKAIDHINNLQNNTCQDNNLKKARIYYFNKQTNNEERLFDRLYRDITFITRANNPSKRLSRAARLILSNIEQLLLKSKNKKIIIDHDFLTAITGCLPRQNSNLLAELKDIFNFKYYRFKIFEGKKFSYCYEISFTLDGEKRMTNPALFYDLEGNKLPINPQKITASNIRDKEEALAYSSLSSNNDIDNINARAREENTQESLLPIKSAATNLGSQHPQSVIEPVGNRPIVTTPPATRTEFLATKLTELIKKTFNAELAQELIENLQFNWNEQSNILKVIQTDEYQPDSLHKPILRTLIMEVYGETVRITTAKPKENINQQSTGQTETKIINTSTWETIKQSLVGKIGKNEVFNWFGDLKREERPRQIIFTGTACKVDMILNKFLLSLIKLCREFSIEIYFCVENVKLMRVNAENLTKVNEIDENVILITNMDELCKEFNIKAKKL